MNFSNCLCAVSGSAPSGAEDLSCCLKSASHLSKSSTSPLNCLICEKIENTNCIYQYFGLSAAYLVQHAMFYLLLNMRYQRYNLQHSLKWYLTFFESFLFMSHSTKEKQIVFLTKIIQMLPTHTHKIVKY